MMKIENEFLKVEVDEKGGALTSLFDKNRKKELLYQPLAESWQGQDIFIFPFIARLVNQTYTIDGKEYSLKNHGLIRYMVGSSKKVDEEDCSVFFASDEESLQKYPFSFEASSSYHLDGKRLFVTYHIKNTSEKTMPFMVGGHPAFMLPGVKRRDEFDISGNYITFDKKTKLVRIIQDEKGNYNLGEVYYGDFDKIHLSKEFFFKIKTYIFKADTFSSLTLHKLDGSTIRMEKNDAPILALWSGNEFGNFVAIEPWDGLPDYLDAPKEMKDKKQMDFLESGKEKVFSYSIEID